MRFNAQSIAYIKNFAYLCSVKLMFNLKPLAYEIK